MSAPDLMGLGMPTELAVAVDAAIAAAPASPDFRDFMGLGMPHEQATLIASGIEAQSLDAPELVAVGMPDHLATYIADAIAATVEPLDISGTPVLTGQQGVAYAGFTASGAGGVTPYAYSLVGTWPAGLSVDSGSGEVSGTPTENGSFPDLSVRVTDDHDSTADLDTFTLVIDAP